MVLQEYIFELKNELSELKALNRYLNKWGSDIGLPPDSILRINICIDDTVLNVAVAAAYLYNQN